MNEKKLHNILMIIALCLMTLSFFTVYFQNKTPKIIEKRDTTIVRDTVWRDTTIIEKQLTTLLSALRGKKNYKQSSTTSTSDWNYSSTISKMVAPKK